MKIAILGGSFDPPHLGHILIARQVLEFGPNIDKVLFVPAYQHQWKPIAASPKDRLAMIGLVLEDPPVGEAGKMGVSDIELRRGGISYSTDTIKSLKAQTKAEIYWIIGSDILPEFHRWKKTEDLVKEAKFIVLPRDPNNIPGKLPKGFEMIKSKDLLITNISSTIIRQRIKDKKTIKYLVPGEIERYIKESKLYV